MSVFIGEAADHPIEHPWLKMPSSAAVEQGKAAIEDEDGCLQDCQESSYRCCDPGVEDIRCRGVLTYFAVKHAEGRPDIAVCETAAPLPQHNRQITILEGGFSSSTHHVLMPWILHGIDLRDPACLRDIAQFFESLAERPLRRRADKGSNRLGVPRVACGQPQPSQNPFTALGRRQEPDGGRRVFKARPQQSERCIDVQADTCGAVLLAPRDGALQAVQMIGRDGQRVPGRVTDLMWMGASIVSSQGASCVDNRGVRIHPGALLPGHSPLKELYQLGEVCLFICHGSRRYLQQDHSDESISYHGSSRSRTSALPKSKMRIAQRKSRRLLLNSDHPSVSTSALRHAGRLAAQHTSAANGGRELMEGPATSLELLAGVDAEETRG